MLIRCLAAQHLAALVAQYLPVSLLPLNSNLYNAPLDKDVERICLRLFHAGFEPVLPSHQEVDSVQENVGSRIK